MNHFSTHFWSLIKSGVVLIFIAWSCSVQASDPLRIEISQGAIKGTQQGRSIQFKGIPYAKAPVGNNRWQPPSAPDKFEGQFLANQYGPVCPQRQNKTVQSEDCLSLNIFSPANPAVDEGGLPILVWIHGGGFVFGSGNMSSEGHKNWNDNDIILVTFNYRLGALGIFAPSALSFPEGNNFSVMDMVAALKWLKTNIGAFGGDPNRITIAGGSAGGMAVQMLMVNPDSKGLFQGAISQSGYGAWPLPRTSKVSKLASSPSAHIISNQIAQKALNVSANKVTKSLLYTASADALVAAIDGFHVPIVDGVTLPEEPAVMFLQGKQHLVPFISGGNSYEGSVYPYSGVSPEQLISLMGEHKQQIIELYNLDEASIHAVPYQHLFGDLRYLLAAKLTSQSMDRIGQAGYRYFYNYVSNKQSSPFGSSHASETYMLFQADNVPVLNQMRQYWYNFVATQNPNSPELPHWPILSDTASEWLEIADDVNAISKVRADKLAILEALFQQRTAPVQSPSSQIP